MNITPIIMGACLISAAAMAEEPLWSISKSVAIELMDRGQVSKFMELNLTDGGNAILHGYEPHQGDIVEWYVRSVEDCDDISKKCVIELAIRKRP
jgi:hypothetical protein